MEQEHLILAALVLIVIFMVNKGCDCKKNEKFDLEGQGLMAQRIRYGYPPDEGLMAQRIRYGEEPGPIGMAQRIRYGSEEEPAQMAQRIRYGSVEEPAQMAQRIRQDLPGPFHIRQEDKPYTSMAQHVNMNNDYQGRLMNHIRRDSKREMIHNIMTGCGDK